MIAMLSANFLTEMRNVLEFQIVKSNSLKIMG
jgi:hypothetical protein